MGFFPLTKFFLFLKMKTPGLLSLAHFYPLYLSPCLSLPHLFSSSPLPPLSFSFSHTRSQSSVVIIHFPTHTETTKFALKPQNVQILSDPSCSRTKIFLFLIYVGFSFAYQEIPFHLSFWLHYTFSPEKILSTTQELQKTPQTPPSHLTVPQITPLEISRLEHHAI